VLSICLSPCSWEPDLGEALLRENNHTFASPSTPQALVAQNQAAQPLGVIFRQLWASLQRRKFPQAKFPMDLSLDLEMGGVGSYVHSKQQLRYLINSVLRL
jgi:hypothetical protein